VPLFEKVIDFQEQFGGIWYKIGEKSHKGFKMDMMYYHDFKEKYVLKYFTEKDGKYIFQCMEYHYAGDVGPCIDEAGKIYYCAMGKFIITAESIEEFLEDEGIKFYFVSKQPSWLNRGLKLNEVEEFKKVHNLIKIERKAFTYKYFEWWCNAEETIFIRINLVNREYYAHQLYCENQEVLDMLYKENTPACIFP
jgi:hypothetical protein